MAMALVKTQIYLTRAQHRALTREARRQGISLAQLVRKLADRHLDAPAAEASRPDAWRGIVKLGRSGISTTSADHHRALDDLLARGPVR